MTPGLRSIFLALASLLLVACSEAGRESPTAVEAAPEAGLVENPVRPDVPLVSECGFFEVGPQPTAAKYAARLFYSFRPADIDAAHKPIALLFNGGPGFATTAGLLAYGTGPFTLEGTEDAGAAPVANRASWTSFANLLYVDMRLAGLSYGLMPSSDTQAFSPAEDAADFVRALLAFFDLHAALRANPVILVGESYGGVRAQYFLDIVLRYSTQAAAGGPDLRGLLQAHFDALFPAHVGAVFDEATIATQFGAQVLIEPLVLGELQYATQAALEPSDPYVGSSAHLPLDSGAPPDPYDVTEPDGWSDGLTANAATALSREETATPLLGVALRSIDELLPPARTSAFHPFSEQFLDPAPLPGDPLVAANTSLTALLGALDANDSYFEPLAQFELSTENVDPNVFVANLYHVRTFITDARYDSVIYGPAIPATLSDGGIDVVVDQAPRPGVARPGWFSVALAATAPTAEPDASTEAATTVEVRFPAYTSSGHMVAVSQPSDLHDDVAAWLARD